MKVLIDIGHPAHVHFFKNAIKQLHADGHETAIITKDKEVAINLLKRLGLPYHNLGRPGQTIAAKATAMFRFDWEVLKIARRERPDIMVSISSPYVAHVAKLIGRPNISFWDTESAWLIQRLTYPFSDAICTPACYKTDLGAKQVRFEGYKELAYLHPNHFTPDPAVLDTIGVSRGERFIVLRFISWAASHDVGLSGIAKGPELVRELEEYGKVFISSERPLEPALQPYRLAIQPDQFHSLLAYAGLYIGEGGTTAVEAALLGTPAIHIEADKDGTATGNQSGNFTEIRDRYDMMYFYPDERSAFAKAKEILADEHAKDAWAAKRRKLLAEKIDVAAWMTRFIEEYPASFARYQAEHR